jgi:hypothetical protein
MQNATAKAPLCSPKSSAGRLRSYNGEMSPDISESAGFIARGLDFALSY